MLTLGDDVHYTITLIRENSFLSSLFSNNLEMSYCYLNMFTIINKYILDLSKLEPLDGTNYHRWFQRIVIIFKQLEVDYILFNPPATNKPKNSNTVPKDLDVVATKAKFEKENKMVRSHMLSHMTNNLFDLFVKNKSAKSI
ncbi:hypothetical protein ES332_D12G082300v1 [Gossypium tomentosum]|uniref:Uncharacterized protein n=1 Tax=Gossypium tomentosum TaxID=34277 RepID=A0A5D2I640_GOSTO|nr:hypothetical protein ES332_D12G082300v1 [Gossypium tomentosum]